jgi:hypothetical protein
MKLSYLASFAQNLNRAMDSGKYDDISVQEIEEHIIQKDLLRFLSESLRDEIDVSIFKSNPELENELIDFFDSLRCTLGVDSSYHKGLSQLIEWILMMIAQKKWS